MYSDSRDLVCGRYNIGEMARSIALLLFALGIVFVIKDLRFLALSDAVDASVIQSYSYSAPCGKGSSCTEYGNRVRFKRPGGQVFERNLLDTGQAYPTGAMLTLNIRWGAHEEIRIHSIRALFGRSLLLLFAGLTLFLVDLVLRGSDTRARRSLRFGFFSEAFKAAYGKQFHKTSGLDQASIGRRTAFMVATFSMFAKMAKADESVTEDEVSYVDRIIREQFRLDEQSRKVAIQIFRHARNSPLPFAEHAVEFERIFHREPRMLRQMLELLHQLAMADGNLSPQEESLLRQASEIFGIPSSRFKAHAETNSRIKNSVDPYQILGVRASASSAEIKRAYRKLVKEHHPDTLTARGVPPELVRAAADRFRKVQAAYEEITQKR